MMKVLAFLRDAAAEAREAELANDRIDECELIVRENDVVIVAKRNGHLSLSPRRVTVVRSVSWGDLIAAEESPFSALIADAVLEMNAEPKSRAPSTNGAVK